jgi:hypothetical protein
MAHSEEAPTCPYCGAAWTTAMRHALDRHTRGVACACCVLMPGLDLEKPAARPQRDLCCESCGNPIYSAPAAAAYT